jgi:glucose-6-phosphate-specific signal transduction histidine kinase
MAQKPNHGSPPRPTQTQKTISRKDAEAQRKNNMRTIENIHPQDYNHLRSLIERLDAPGFSWRHMDYLTLRESLRLLLDDYDEAAKLQAALTDWLDCSDMPAEWARCRDQAKQVLGRPRS